MAHSLPSNNIDLMLSLDSELDQIAAEMSETESEPIQEGDNLHSAVLWDNFQRTGDISLLQSCIELEREALDSCPAGHLNREAALSTLAMSLVMCFELTHDHACLDEAIDLERELLLLRPVGHRDRATSCEGLASLLRVKFHQAKDNGALVEAVGLFREALRVCPENYSGRPELCMDLSSLLAILSDQTGNDALMDEAIEFEMKAIQLLPIGHPDRAQSCGNVAGLLTNRSRKRNDPALVDEAIILGREALESHLGASHPLQASFYFNLGNALSTKFNFTGNHELHSEAIELKRRALELVPEGHPDQAGFCANLAESLIARHDYTGDDVLLEEAITLQRKVMQLCPADHPDHDSSCEGLAVALSALFDRTGDDDLLRESISLHEQALQLRPEGHPFRAKTCVNLAAMFSSRFEQRGDSVLLDEAIRMQREAQCLYSDDDPDRAKSNINLSSLLVAQFDRTEDQALLNEAIALLREVLDNLPVGHPDRAGASGNLAIALQTRFEKTGNPALLDEALVLAKESLTILPVGHPGRWRILLLLANFHTYVYPLTRSRDTGAALSNIDEALRSNADNLPGLLITTASLLHRVSAMLLSHNSVNLMLKLLSDIIDLGLLVAGFVLNPDTQLQYLAACREIGRDACLWSSTYDNPELGLQLLERARGVIWSQMLHLREPQSQDVPPALATEFKALMRRLNQGRIQQRFMPGGLTYTLQPSDKDVLHQDHGRLQRLIREIRSFPGMDNFMRGPTQEALLTTATKHPVVVLIEADHECHALIIRSSETPVSFIPLEHIDPSQIQALVTNVILSRLNHDANPELDEDENARVMKPRQPQEMLTVLWRGVVKPVISHLKLEKKALGSERSRVYWCPTGVFSFVPLHAAGIYSGAHQECCADYMVSSYTPTLAALSRAQATITPLEKGQLKLLLIAAKTTQGTHLRPLANVHAEVEKVIEIAQTASVFDTPKVPSPASTSEVAKLLETANIVHVASHGNQNLSEPLKSGICLVDGTLTVEQIMRLDLRDAFFAFLSACETAKGDREQPDQTIHLAATLLFTGFKSVVATMWTMKDQDGPVVAKLFYEKLFERDVIDADSIPHALDHAITTLRKSGASWERWATFVHMGA